MDVERNQQELIKTKGSDRIQINNILAATAIAILSVLLGLAEAQFSTLLVIQLAAAIPLLVTSSLAYAKIGYRDVSEYSVWDNLGWATLTLGYILILNALAIMLFTSGYASACWWFIAVMVSLFVLYSIIDVLADRKRLREKSWKLGVYLAIMMIGSILPISAGWV